ncbi:MAG: hypothetical protein R3E12_20630, partial [Candidatus Eisenbacteria bacterium]
MIPSISTMPARRRLGVVLVLLSVLVGSSAHAGVDGGSRLPTEYRSWKLETAGGQELRISQIYVPLVGTVFLRPSTRVVVSAAAGRSRYERPRVSTEGEIGANVTDALSG